MTKIMSLSSLLLLSLLIGIGCSKSDGNQTGSSVEKPKAVATEERSYQSAPDFTLESLDGKKISLSDYSGKLVFVNFWATWCPPCRAEIPGFIKLYDRYNNAGLEIIGISTDQDGKEVVKNFVAQNNVNYPIAMYNMDVVYAYGGITGIPTTFVVNPKGEVVNKFVGYPGEEAFEQEIQKWLPKKSAM